MEGAADQVVQLLAHPLGQAGFIAFNMQFHQTAHHHCELTRSRHGLGVDPRVDIAVLLELAVQQFSAAFQTGFNVAVGVAASKQRLHLRAAVGQVAIDSWQRTIARSGTWPGFEVVWLLWRDDLRDELQVVVSVVALSAGRLLLWGWFR